MNYKIVTYPQFEKELKRLAKKYKSLKSDFVTFLQELQENPNEGAQLGHGLRKVRMSIASKGKGKSGGARVITLTAIVDVENIRDWFVVRLRQIRERIHNRQGNTEDH